MHASFVEVINSLLLLFEEYRIVDFQVFKEHDYLAIKISDRVSGTANDSEVVVLACVLAHGGSYFNKAFHIILLQNEHTFVTCDTDLVSSTVFYSEVIIDLFSQIFMDITTAISKWYRLNLRSVVWDLKDCILRISSLIIGLLTNSWVFVLTQLSNRLSASKVLADSSPTL